MLELRNISFAYNPKYPVIQDISLSIADGEFIAVVGRNGSGKTTLTRLIMALKKPSAGEIIINDKIVRKCSPADMARHIGYVFQNPDRQIFRDTVASEVSYGPEQLGFLPAQTKELVNEALAATGLGESAQAYPPTLSRGQKQRLAIASALAMQPKILILDEPTSGQDSCEKAQLMQLLTQLNKQGITILLITHDMDLLAAYAKRVIVLHKGTKAFDGPTAELFKDSHQLIQWGLSEPVSINVSRSLTKLGIKPTTSLDALTDNLIKVMGRDTNAANRTAY